MKRILFLLVICFFGGVSNGMAGGQEAETFVLVNSHEIRISIEHYQQRDGLTPVVLAIGELEITGEMDDQGRVFVDVEDYGRVGSRPMMTLNMAEKMMTVGKQSHSLSVFERNETRIRMRVTTGIVPLQLNVDWAKQNGEILLGDARLPVTLRAREKSPGFLTIEIMGPNVLVQRELAYDRATQSFLEVSGETAGARRVRSMIWARRVE